MLLRLTFSLIICLSSLSLYGETFEESLPEGNFQVEESQTDQATDGTCGCDPTDSNCNCSAKPLDPAAPRRFGLPQGYSSRRCRRNCDCYGDLDDDWYEEDPTWPGKREEPWVDDLPR